MAFNPNSYGLQTVKAGARGVRAGSGPSGRADHRQIYQPLQPKPQRPQLPPPQSRPTKQFSPRPIPSPAVRPQSPLKPRPPFPAFNPISMLVQSPPLASPPAPLTASAPETVPEKIAKLSPPTIFDVGKRAEADPALGRRNPAMDALLSSFRRGNIY